MSLSNPSDISNSDPSTIAQDRKTCWIARDQFFSCLNGSFSSGELYTELKASKDTSDILPKSLRTPCDKLRDIMYSSCPHSWVIKCTELKSKQNQLIFAIIKLLYSLLFITTCLL